MAVFPLPSPAGSVNKLASGKDNPTKFIEAPVLAADITFPNANL